MTLTARAIKTLKVIQDNGTIHNSAIAKTLGLGSADVLYNVRKLLDLGLIEYFSLGTEPKSSETKPLKINPSKKEEVSSIIKDEANFWGSYAIAPEIRGRGRRVGG